MIGNSPKGLKLQPVHLQLTVGSLRALVLLNFQQVLIIQ